MDKERMGLFPRRTATAITAALMCAALIPFLVGCGGAASGANPPASSVAKTTVQVNMGDSPADWMLAFSMNISSMSLTGSNGSVTVASRSTPMEMLHLMGTMQPLAMLSAPQGTYTGATVTIDSATVMYMDPNTKSLVQATIPGPIAATVNFGGAMTVGSTPMAMGFDLDLANSIALTSNGGLSMTPVFHVTSGAQGSGTPSDFMDGGIEQMMGSVSSVSGNSFVMTSMQAAQSFTFATNSSTVFNGTSLGSMSNGMLVMVDATLQADGSLLATRVRSTMGGGGVMGGGILTAVTGSPATSLAMVMQNGAGTGMMSSYFASGATVALNGSTTYQINSDGIDLSGLPFTPVFDASHIYAGQSVMPVSSTGMMSGGMGGGMMGGAAMGGTITATELMLAPQGLSGTAGTAINSGATANLTLTLPTESAFTTLTGVRQITVFQQQETTVSGTSPIAAGLSIHAFGLLFFDGGQWKMVAARIGAN